MIKRGLLIILEDEDLGDFERIKNIARARKAVRGKEKKGANWGGYDWIHGVDSYMIAEPLMQLVVNENYDLVCGYYTHTYPLTHRERTNGRVPTDDLLKYLPKSSNLIIRTNAPNFSKPHHQFENVLVIPKDNGHWIDADAFCKGILRSIKRERQIAEWTKGK